jgi:uncharacterized membrane protein HdeD (DUF308 family)
MFKKIYFATVLITLPVFAFAQLKATDTFLRSAKDIITNVLVPLAFILALLFFFWGIAKYIWSVGTDKDEGKKMMIWGVVALFVMSSVWGIISYLQDEFIISKTTEGTIPTIK